MKKALLVLIVSIFTTTLFAQQQLATLNHDGNITVYYGINALSQAHGSAETGDIITLSPGLFNSTNITKAITIRGAGAWEVNGNQNTVLRNDFTISIPNDSLHHLILEGLYFYNYVRFQEVHNPQFV